MEERKKSLNSAIEVPFLEEAIIDDVKNHLDAFGRAYATGRRKRASARIWLAEGDSVEINGKKFEEYFVCESSRKHALEPLVAVGMESAKIFGTVCGGGVFGQAGAIRHAVARALLNFDASLKEVLRSGGFLTRDSRKKERKTPGFRTARKPQQWNAR